MVNNGSRFFLIGYFPHLPIGHSLTRHYTYREFSCRPEKDYFTAPLLFVRAYLLILHRISPV